MEEEIIISFAKHRQIISKLFMINKSFNHDIYEEIGVKRIDKFKNDGIHFQVINKEKLIYAMMKYNFTLHDEKISYIETSKGRRVYLDEKPNKSS